MYNPTPPAVSEPYLRVRKFRTTDETASVVRDVSSQTDAAVVINGGGPIVIINAWSGILREPSPSPTRKTHYTQQEYDAIYDEIYAQEMEHDDYLD